jgi:hypothetical protein
MNAPNDASDTDDIDAILQVAFGLDDGPIKVGMIEEAVRLAEMRANDDMAQDLRSMLIEAAIFGGRSDVALVTFSRNLAYSDAHPDEVDEHSLLWQYKWIVGNLDEFPQITRAQIEQSLSDLESRAATAGYSPYAVEKLRWSLSIGMGDRPAAEAAYAKFEGAKRDGLGDCLACVEDERVRYLAFVEQPEQALKVAEPILKKRLTCKEIPHRTYGRVLEPLFRLGRLEEAADFHRKGYRLIQRNPEFLAQIAEHLIFLVLTANTEKSLTVLARNLPVALHAVPGRQLDFLCAAVFALLAAGQQGKKSVKLALPESLDFYREDGKYPVTELQQSLRVLAGNLAAQFDARNGNSSRRDHLDSLPGLVADVRPHSVVVSRKVDRPE